MKINYKKIEHERVGDAPFIGALISACDCNFNCNNCFNQNLKHSPTLCKEEDEIIQEIKSNPFNKGIIFAGLEWSLQEKEMMSLAFKAKSSGLKTMVYTGHSIDSEFVQRLIRNENIDYIKYGKFKEKKRTYSHIEYGVVLASANQHIISRENI